MPEHLIDQIKAGEVIERPSALLKELVENSIDAGATVVDIRIVNAGLDLISISDNGGGMSYDDLPLAFTRHATSKLNSFQDLYALATYGFRGEALASIASIARVSAWSTPHKKPEQSGKIEIHGAKIISHTPYNANGSFGTTIQARDLFFNTPARLQFARSKLSEKKAIEKTLQAFLIANHTIEFNIIWEESDGQTSKKCYPQAPNFETRANKILEIKLYGSTDKNNYASYRHQDYNVQAVISIKANKSTHKKHCFVANKRQFFDKALHQILMKSMLPLWPMGLSGDYIISLTVPPAKIDVNIHPNKTQLKFSDFNIVAALVRQMGQMICEQNKSSKIESNIVSEQSSPQTSQGQITTEARVKQQAHLPEAQILVLHPTEGLLLVDKLWLLQCWWKHIGQHSKSQVPLLIAPPIIASKENMAEWSKWAAFLNSISISAILDQTGKILIRAIPIEMQELPVLEMITPLFKMDINLLQNFNSGQMNIPIPLAEKDILQIISNVFPHADQFSGPVLTWKKLEQWWKN